MLFSTHIREATVEQLTRLGLFQTVFNAREPVIVREQLPCCKVWTPREGGDNLSIGVPELRSTVDLVIQIVIEGNFDDDNAQRIDEMVERVMLYLVEDPNWLVRFERLLSLETAIETNTDGEMRTVTATMTFVLQYAYIFITRIVDRLDTLDTTVAPPEQPTGPAGEPGEENVRFVVRLPR
jgi:hypothetical protein